MTNKFESKLILCDNEWQFYEVVEVVEGLGYQPYSGKSGEWEAGGYNVRLWEDGEFTREVWDNSDELETVAAEDFLAQHNQPVQSEETSKGEKMFKDVYVNVNNETEFSNVVEAALEYGYEPFMYEGREHAVWQSHKNVIHFYEDGTFTSFDGYSKNCITPAQFYEVIYTPAQVQQQKENSQVAPQHNIKTLFQAPSGETFDTMEQAVLHDKLWQFLTNELDIADTDNFDVAFEKAVKAIREDISERKGK